MYCDPKYINLRGNNETRRDEGNKKLIEGKKEREKECKKSSYEREKERKYERERGREREWESGKDQRDTLFYYKSLYLWIGWRWSKFFFRKFLSPKARTFHTFHAFRRMEVGTLPYWESVAKTVQEEAATKNKKKKVIITRPFVLPCCTSNENEQKKNATFPPPPENKNGKKTPFPICPHPIKKKKKKYENRKVNVSFTRNPWCTRSKLFDREKTKIAHAENARARARVFFLFVTKVHLSRHPVCLFFHSTSTSTSRKQNKKKKAKVMKQQTVPYNTCTYLERKTCTSLRVDRKSVV